MEQVLFGGYYGLVNDTSDRYNSLIGGKLWAGTYGQARNIVSADGIIKNFRVKLNASPGAGKHYTFTLYLNGVPTALTFDIVDGATTGSNMINQIDVAPGDTVSIQCDPDGTPTERYVTWTLMFEGDTAAESLILGGYDGQSKTNIEYGHVMGASSSFTTVEDNARVVVPTAGTVKNLYVELHVAPGTDPDAYRFTVRLNGATVAQSLIVTITAPATTGSDLIHNLVVAAGDRLTIMCEPLNIPSATVASSFSMVFVADIDGESITMGGSAIDLDAALTEYIYTSCSRVDSWINDETQRYSLGQVCTVRKLYVLLSAAPGVGNDRDFAIRIAGTNVVTLQISDAAITGDSGGLSDTVANDEYVGIRTIPISTPDGADAYWGFVSYLEPPPIEGGGAGAIVMGTKSLIETLLIEGVI